MHITKYSYTPDLQRLAKSYVGHTWGRVEARNDLRVYLLLHQKIVYLRQFAFSGLICAPSNFLSQLFPNCVPQEFKIWAPSRPSVPCAFPWGLEYVFYIIFTVHSFVDTTVFKTVSDEFLNLTPSKAQHSI